MRARGRLGDFDLVEFGWGADFDYDRCCCWVVIYYYGFRRGGGGVS